MEILSQNSELVLSICALGLSIWAIISSRKHNRLSVKPFLQTFQHNDLTAFYIEVLLMNNGVGPAILQPKLKIIYDRKIYNTVERLFSQKFIELYKQIDWDKNRSHTINTEYALKVNEKLHICSLNLNSKEITEEVKTIIDSIDFLQNYNDIYGTNFVMK